MFLLKEAVSRRDASEEACFLLGSQYASLNLFSPAAHWMQKAIDLNPDYALARFQLGLLLLTQGMATEAELTWAPLERLGSSDYLGAFRIGLLHLIKDEFREASHWLLEGVRLNGVNESLNNDMRMLAGEVLKLQQSKSNQDTPPLPPAETTDGTDLPDHLFLNAYRNTSH